MASARAANTASAAPSVAAVEPSVGARSGARPPERALLTRRRRPGDGGGGGAARGRAAVRSSDRKRQAPAPAVHADATAGDEGVGVSLTRTSNPPATGATTISTIDHPPAWSSGVGPRSSPTDRHRHRSEQPATTSSTSTTRRVPSSSTTTPARPGDDGEVDLGAQPAAELLAVGERPPQVLELGIDDDRFGDGGSGVGARPGERRGERGVGSVGHVRNSTVPRGDRQRYRRHAQPNSCETTTEGRALCWCRPSWRPPTAASGPTTSTPGCLRDRIVFLGSAIDDQVANLVVAQLLHLEAEDHDREISLYVNSPGGDMIALFAIHDTMQFVHTPISTICVGQAASAAAVLLAAGTPGRRLALPNAHVLIHQPHGGAQGQSTDLEIQIRETVELRDRMVDILVTATGRPAGAGPTRHRPRLHPAGARRRGLRLRRQGDHPPRAALCPRP